MDGMINLFADPGVWAALTALIVMEVVLGIDNLAFGLAGYARGAAKRGAGVVTPTKLPQILNAKKSVFSGQLARNLDINQTSAWCMQQRMRVAMLTKVESRDERLKCALSGRSAANH